MKKLKILISTLSVMALMCFANMASAQASYLLTTQGGATYPTGQVVQVNATIALTSNGEALAISMAQSIPDLNTRAIAVGNATSTEVSVSANQILITPDPSTDLRALSNHFFNQGIAISKEILMLLQ